MSPGYPCTVKEIEKEIAKLEREAKWMIEHGHLRQAMSIGYFLRKRHEELDLLRDIEDLEDDIQVNEAIPGRAAFGPSAI
jgi:hypothetical protein